MAKEKVEKKKINVLEHSLVPKHEILTQEEAEKLFQKYNVSIQQIPKVLSNDPVVKALEAKQGEILKIIRKDLTLGQAIAYRAVVGNE